MKNLTWQNPEQLFVAQELINKVKSKCCGIKVIKADCRFPLVLERIVLGPNLKERSINKEQLLLMFKYGQINVTDNFEIIYSDINSYR